jgi:hypothetical protein
MRLDLLLDGLRDNQVVLQGSALVVRGISERMWYIQPPWLRAELFGNGRIFHCHWLGAFLCACPVYNLGGEGSSS